MIGDSNAALAAATAREKTLLLVAYALGGAVALTYQIVWFHAFVERFGATGTTFLTVLCSFIGGLSAGSFASTGVYRKLEALAGGHGLKNYGRTELAVAMAAILALSVHQLPASWLLGEFPYRTQLLNGLTFFVPTAAYQFLKISSAVIGIGLPCFLMGLTFPYLCSLYPDDSRFPSRLYAANTLGACLAILFVEFFALSTLGYMGCLSAAAIVNLGIGLVYLNARRSTHTRLSQTPVATEKISSFPAILSGFLCGGLQALGFLLLKFTLGPSKAAYALLTFFAILGIWLAANIVHRWRPSRLALVCAAWIGLGWCVAIWFGEAGISQWLVAYGVKHLDNFSPYTTGFLITAAVVGTQILIPYFTWSLLLPDLCDRLQERGQDLARTYGWNTISFLAGILIFGWALQYLHFFFAAKAFAVLAAAGLLSWTLMKRDSVSKMLLGSIAVIAAAVIAFIPRGLDLRILGGISQGAKVAQDYRSTPQHLFWVQGSSKVSNKALIFDRHSMSGTSETASRYMKGMAHFPLLLHGKPQRALLICFGVGLTADAIRSHDSIQQLDIVDLNRSVFELNRSFQEQNHRVLQDPRIRIIIDDGRQFLKWKGEKYDFVTMEPPPPLQLGISRLFSMEFYRAVQSRLQPGGIVSQWLPEEQLDSRATDLIASTFVQSFPHTFLFTGCRRELILVGSNEPFEFDKVLGSLPPKVVEDMKRLRVGPYQYLRSIIKVEDGMVSTWGEGETISDGFTSLESIHVGPAQQLHPGAEFRLYKSSLRYDIAGVQRYLQKTAPKSAAIVASFFLDPFSDPDALRIVPPAYFPNAEELIRRKSSETTGVGQE